jgi:putative ABC transport system permease protein
MKLLLLMAKNLRRSPLRTALTTLGTMVLVCVITLIWSVLWFLATVTTERAANFKAIATERWQIPSQMPFAYAATLSRGAARDRGDVVPRDHMTWQFYGGTLDLKNRTRDNSLFAVAMEPSKIATMLDELEDLRGKEADELRAIVREMELDRTGLVLGPGRLRAMNKKVGETIKLYGINYKEIDLEFRIVGSLPEGRYAESALMNRDYLNAALDQYERSHRGQKHRLAEKTLNLVWLRVNDRVEFERLAAQIDRAGLSSPAVKCETQASGVSAFLEAYKDLIWGMRWLLSPAIVVTLSLVIANAIGISVRERRTEMAVLKVLGFQPWQLLTLVLGEALAIGALSGLVSSAATYALVNTVFGGIKFPIAFFPAFFIPPAAFWWGLALGSSTALAGSLLPAWSARNVKVADVFAKVA